MEDLLAARLQMAFSLGFHIIFACIGMVMPFLMAVAHYRWLKTRDQVYLDLTKAWSKGVAIFFAVGAVSGTLLSFELGLLWPKFMEHAGPIFGLPFSWEGTAFFLEAIALGIFLYGWGYLNEWVHWVCGVLVGVTGLCSGILVVAANAWMNAPQGFTYSNGEFTDIDPVAAFFNKAWFTQALHMSIAAFVATCFAVAGLHAYLLLRNKENRFHRLAVQIALSLGALAAIVQPLSGDLSAKDVAQRQPIKLAAMESHFHTESNAPLLLGGIPDVDNQTVRFGIELPGLLSFLAHGDFSAEVKGLNDFPRELWPPVLVVHIAFQIMVACGGVLALLGVYYIVQKLRRREPLDSNAYLRALAAATPLGMIAVEAGWIVTEVGRQPWIIYGIMKTKDSLTPMPGLVYSLVFYVAIYIILSIVLVWLMRRQILTLESTYPSAKATQ